MTLTRIERRRRQKEQRYLKQEAQDAWFRSDSAKPWKDHYHDGKVVHSVVTDKRTLAVVRAGEQAFESRQIWATTCGRVVAVNEPKFPRTIQQVTCLTCIAPPEPRSIQDLIKQHMYKGS